MSEELSVKRLKYKIIATRLESLIKKKQHFVRASRTAKFASNRVRIKTGAGLTN